MNCQIITDASSVAWAAMYDDKVAQGSWNRRVQHEHSNYRELLAVLLGLMSFAHTIEGKSVQFLCDNVAAVAYVNFQGPTGILRVRRLGTFVPDLTKAVIKYFMSILSIGLDSPAAR